MGRTRLPAVEGRPLRAIQRPVVHLEVQGTDPPERPFRVLDPQDNRLAASVAPKGPAPPEQMMRWSLGRGDRTLVGGHPHEMALVLPPPPVLHHQLVSHARRAAFNRGRAERLVETQPPDGGRQRTGDQFADGDHPLAVSLAHVGAKVDLRKVHEAGNAPAPDPGVEEVERDQGDLRLAVNQVGLHLAGQPGSYQGRLYIVCQEDEIAPARRQRGASSFGEAGGRG